MEERGDVPTSRNPPTFKNLSRLLRRRTKASCLLKMEWVTVLLGVEGESKIKTVLI